jgi:transglutaminase-like putative cysteine protease
VLIERADAIDEHALATTFALAALIVLPYLSAPYRSRLRPWPAVPPSMAPLTWPFQMLPILALPGGAAVWLMAMGVLAQGNLLTRSRQDGAAGWCLPLGPALVFGGMALVASDAWALLLPLSLYCAAMALLALQERRATARHVLHPPRGYGSTAVETEPQTRRWIRLPLQALPLALVTLVLLSGLYVPLVDLPKPWLDVWDIDASELEREPPSGGPQQTGTEARSAFRQMFPSNFRYSGGVSRLVHERVMEIVPREIGGGARPMRAWTPMYLRGLVLETFTDEGARYDGSDRLQPFTDAGDHVRDGWTELAERSTDGEFFELAIRQQPLLVRAGAWSILFSPEPSLAVNLPSVRHDPDGLLVATEAPEDWFDYRVVSVDRRATSLALGAERAVHPDPRFTQLPEATPELEHLSQRAQAICVLARTDVGRVEALVEYFKRDFEYTLQSADFPGLHAVVGFMRRRKGHCTHFASATALMLRTQGIPARVATGFVTGDWSDKESCFVVSTKNAHAWVEVHYEGVGWVTYDPTPSERRLAALRERSGLGTGMGVWVGDVVDDFRQWAASGGDSIYLESLFGTLLQTPRALGEGLRRAPLLLGGSFALLLLIAAWGIARRWRRSAAEHHRRDGTLADSHYQRILRLLARHGYHKHPAQTPREFARAVVRAGGESFARLRPITERIYRVRFGGVDLSPNEVHVIDAFIADLKESRRGYGV